VLGIRLWDTAVDLGEDAGHREHLHKAAHHGVAHALRRRPDAERREQHLRSLGARGILRGGVGRPSGFAGWLPSAATLGASSAMAVTCRGEFGVDHAGTRGSMVSVASGGRVSQVKPCCERFGVDFLFIYKNVEGKAQWAVGLSWPMTTGVSGRPGHLNHNITGKKKFHGTWWKRRRHWRRKGPMPILTRSRIGLIPTLSALALEQCSSAASSRALALNGPCTHTLDQASRRQVAPLSP
jgi:hypothetical protein